MLGSFPVAAGEHLTAQAVSFGFGIGWVQLSVVTSRRQVGRAPDGFAAHLRSLLASARAEPA